MNINIKLNKNFTSLFNKLSDKYGEGLAYLNGFGDDQLSYTDFIDNFVDKDTIADASIDGNSNVSHKDIVTLEREMPKPHSKLIAFNKVYYEIQKKYGFQAANEWLEMEWKGQLYMHDSNSCSFRHYCFSYDLTDLAEKGLFFIEGQNAQPAKHLTTFVDFVKEFISYAANRSSGAVGLPNLLIYMYYFWKKDVENNYVIRNPEYYAKQSFQRFIYAVNQPYVRDGSQSAFTNTQIYDHPYFEALFGGTVFPDGTYAIDYEDEIIEFQKWYLEVMADIRKQTMFTFPVNTISLLRGDGKFVDEEFAKWAIQHNMIWADSNLFIDTSVNSLSQCCRMKGSIEDLGYFNSIGGTALKVGSVKVSTINLARLALDTNNEDEYLKELQHRVIVDLRALDRIRYIIKRNVEKELLPNFSYGLVDFKYLYNTIGFIGVYETMKKFGYTDMDKLGNTFYTEKASQFGKKIFDTIRSTADEFLKNENSDYQISVEQIPGEQSAAKLMLKDKYFYPDANIYDLPLYGNQFIPLGIKTTLQERIRIAAEFDRYCNGG